MHASTPGQQRRLPHTVVVLAPEGREPFGASAQDGGGHCHGLHIGDGGGAAVEAHIGGEGGLEAGLTLLALQALQQRGLLPCSSQLVP